MGIEANAAGHLPEIAPTAYVHPTATIIGCVWIGNRVFVGPNAVIRADEIGPDGNIEPIVVEDSANIQDGAIIHALGGTGVLIGPRTSVAHAAIIHGPCRIGARCFIGFHSIVFHAALDDGVIVMHQSVVEHAVLSEGLFVPSLTAVRGKEDALRLERAPDKIVAFAEKVIGANTRLADAASRNLANTF